MKYLYNLKYQIIMNKKLVSFLFVLFITCGVRAASPLTSDYLNNDYTGNWGKLKLVGTQLSSESGEAIQLKGWSTHGWQFGDVKKVTFDSKAGFAGMKSFGANVARIAAYMSPNDRVTDEEMVQNITDWVKRCMAWTFELNMYCIVDLHVHDPGFPTYYLQGETLGRNAEAFFAEICREVVEKGYNHVIYEICNEPSGKGIEVLGGVSAKKTWENVKEYAAKILPIIEQNDPTAVVVVGVPQACLRLDIAAEDPISTVQNSRLNIMYTFHFYACSHLNDFNKYLKSYGSQIPVFATEWSATKADGSSDVCLDNAAEFTNYCRDNKISWCSWSWCGKNERSAAIKVTSRVNDTYVYTESDLTTVGLFVKEKLQESPVSNVSDVKNTLFGIYPNPVKNGTFDITLKEGLNADVDILNVSGQKVYSSNIEDGKITINAAHLPVGVYVVSIKAGNEIQSDKLVIE
jgi:endoglucanase